MKKISVVLSIILGIAMLLTACGGQGGQSSQGQIPDTQPSVEVPETQDSGQADQESQDKIVMATEAGFAPYEYYDEFGNVVGVDPDIAQAIADRMGVALEIREMEFNAIVPEVQAGRVDFGAAGMTINEERSKEVDFSIPYATSKQIIVTRADNNDIAGPDDLNGKNVGVQFGTVADYELTDSYPEVTVERYNKYFEAVSDLENGRLDAIVMDILPAQEFVGQNQAIKIIDKELMTDEYAICVQKGNQELLDQINTVLEELISNGQIDEFTMNHTVQ